MAVHFGTDGIRGLANTGVLAPERLVALGRALARLAAERGGAVALARDPRRSSPMIAAALAAGISSEGCTLLDLGVLPTPALAVLLPALGAGLGVMVSASHNPMRDNGVKVLAADGAKLDDAAEERLEREMDRAAGGDPPVGAAVGDVAPVADALERYVSHLAAAFASLRLDGLRLVVDGANGAAAAPALELFGRLGAVVTPVACRPDGVNINENCGAVHPEAMARAVLEQRADLGVAFDGDGDRVILAGADGSIQDGDRILYVCAGRMLAAGCLAGRVVVGTVMSNFGLELALKELGVHLERTPVGDRHVAAALRRNGWSLGGEPSGHLIFGRRNRFIGDGLFSALEALAAVRDAGRPFHELAAGLVPVPQVLLNVRVARKPAIASVAPLSARIAAGERELEGSGRVLVRYSGTEDLLRVMVEGRDGAQVSRVAREIAATVEQELGAGRGSA